MAHNGSKFGPGKGVILMDDVMCTGDEDNIANCAQKRIGDHNCRHDEDAGVSCMTSNGTYLTEGLF